MSAKTTKLRYAIPHAILLGASAAGIYFSLKNMIIDKNFGTVAVLFWLSMNAYFLTMAILFMTGRINTEARSVIMQKSHWSLRREERKEQFLPAIFPKKGLLF